MVIFGPPTEAEEPEYVANKQGLEVDEARADEGHHDPDGEPEEWLGENLR